MIQTEHSDVTAIGAMKAALIHVQHSDKLQDLIADLYIQTSLDFARSPEAQITALRRIQRAIEGESREYAIQFLVQLKQRLATAFQNQGARE